MYRGSVVIKDFLAYQGVDPWSVDWQAAQRIYLREMQKGLVQRSGSLAMLPSYLHVPDRLPTDVPVLVIDAGGTNLRLARAVFGREGQAVCQDMLHMPMPGSRDVLDADAFFDELARQCAPLLPGVRQIGFCFSFIMRILPNLDAVVEGMSKQVCIRGIEGRLMGECLRQALRRQGSAEDYTVALLNDSIAVLLGGAAAFRGKPVDGMIGFILGTGTNTAYFEGAHSFGGALGRQAVGVSMETSRYNQFHRGRIDAAFDATLSDPGAFPFEKMISGRYLGGLAFMLLQAAADEGLFSAQCTAALYGLPGLESRHLDDFWRRTGPLYTLCEQETDRQTIAALCNALMERAACLVALNLSCVLRRTGAGRDPARPAGILAEGSAFYHSAVLRGKIEARLREFTAGQKTAFQFLHTDHAALTGAAAAALLAASSKR